ncbi:MAG: helix-turn-helix transcriptional regulator [Gammaproteobacteria bacterium]
MPHQLITRPVVLERVGKSASTIDRWERAGLFPRRVRVGPNSVAWYEHEVEDWLASLARGGIERPQPAISERAKRRAELAAAGG